jgi:Tol biopolymer transport system component
MVPMPIGWSPDGSAIVGVEGKRVAYRGVSTPFGETLTDVRIVRVPAAGGHPSLLARLPFEEVGGIAISPDGRWMVCSVYTSRSDVWMVEGFDRAAAR